MERRDGMRPIVDGGVDEGSLAARTANGLQIDMKESDSIPYWLDGWDAGFRSDEEAWLLAADGSRGKG